MILELILATLCTAGFLCSWSMTNLKAHVFGTLFPFFRSQPVEVVEDLLEIRWGRFGELLNCPYCLSSWVGLGLFQLFVNTPEGVMWAVSAFLIPPLLVRVIALERHTATVEAESKEDDEPRIYPDNADAEYEFKAPFEINKKILAIKDNPKKHRELLMRNSVLIGLLHRPGDCPNDECRKICEAFKREQTDMEDAIKKDSSKCPSCTRGSVTNKYFFMLYDLLGEQDVSHQNPALSVEAAKEQPKEFQSKDELKEPTKNTNEEQDATPV